MVGNVTQDYKDRGGPRSQQKRLTTTRPYLFVSGSASSSASMPSVEMLAGVASPAKPSVSDPPAALHAGVGGKAQ